MKSNTPNGLSLCTCCYLKTLFKTVDSSIFPQLEDPAVFLFLPMNWAPVYVQHLLHVGKREDPRDEVEFSHAIRETGARLGQYDSLWLKNWLWIDLSIRPSGRRGMVLGQ